MKTMIKNSCFFFTFIFSTIFLKGKISWYKAGRGAIIQQLFKKYKANLVSSIIYPKTLLHPTPHPPPPSHLSKTHTCVIETGIWITTHNLAKCIKKFTFGGLKKNHSLTWWGYFPHFTDPSQQTPRRRRLALPVFWASCFLNDLKFWTTQKSGECL
jgi:hypothetical protein